MSAAERYSEMVIARERQQQRLATAVDEAHWQRYAPGYRTDPTKLPDALIREVVRRMEMEDDIIEVGGGAGRVGLPLALRGRSLLNVEPSAAMRRQFQLSVDEHEITNAQALASTWPLSEPLSVDLVVCADVTYFVPDIVPFLKAMNQAARRRVAILTWTVPPPNVNGELFRIAFQEPELPAPGYRELLPVLWEIDIVPDVLVVDLPYTWPAAPRSNDDEALQFIFDELNPRDQEAVAERVRPRLGELFMRDDGYIPTWRTPSRGMLITWRTDLWDPRSWRPR